MTAAVECRLCGGTAGQLNDNGVHNLCEARAARGLATPSLGDRCASCGGNGIAADAMARASKHGGGVMLPLELGPDAIGRSIRALFPDCPDCQGKGWTGGGR